MKPLFEGMSELETLRCLVDAAYTTVELHKMEGAYNKHWKAEWLRKAREMGAQPE